MSGVNCEFVCRHTGSLPEKEADNSQGSGYTVPLILFVQEMTGHWTFLYIPNHHCGYLRNQWDLSPALKYKTPE